MGMFVAVLLQAAVALTTVARGTDSQITKPREVAVRSADEWRMLWSEHSGERAPAVDFSRVIVLSIFMGTQPSAGYAVEIVGVRNEGATTRVEYREMRPSPGTLSAQMLTSPFHLVSIPRTTNPIEFRKLAP